MVNNKYILKRSNISVRETEIEGTPAVMLSGVRDFSIEKTFDCGQCFRFSEKQDPRFDYAVSGVAYGKYIELAEKDGCVFIIGSDLADYKSIWRHYLGLDMSYSRLSSDLLRLTGPYPIVKEAYRHSSGIRILNQEHWETLVSFIISQNNNIPRIKMIIERLSREIGEKTVGFDGEEYYAFPTPEAILKEGVDFLKDMGTGFRAKYIIDAAERILSGRTDFGYLEDCNDTDECIRHLSEIYGVGPKVASCALLFSFEKYDAFPRDVWINRVLAKHFSEDFDPALLGDYRGIIQQWLFYSGRRMEL